MKTTTIKQVLIISTLTLVSSVLVLVWILLPIISLVSAKSYDKGYAKKCTEEYNRGFGDGEYSMQMKFFNKNVEVIDE